MFGSGKIGCCDGFGGSSFGNGGACCSLLVAPIMDTCSRAGSFVISNEKNRLHRKSQALCHELQRAGSDILAVRIYELLLH